MGIMPATLVSVVIVHRAQARAASVFDGRVMSWPRAPQQADVVNQHDRVG